MLLLLGCGGSGGGDTFNPEDEVGKDCGGIQTAVCSRNLYCEFPGFSCGAKNTIGSCQLIPDGCTDELNPVCGCDGNIYRNACIASKNSQSLRPIEDCISKN